MNRSRIGVCLATVLLLASVGVPGCGLNVSPDTTIGELLDQLTVGDVVNAFQLFTAGLGGESGNTPLSTEQLAQIESLQGQFNDGLIGQEEFGRQVQSIIGDRAAGRAFAGFGFSGAPFGFSRRSEQAGPLDLTQDQRDQARAIFEALHTDIRTMRSDAHEAIRALLSEEQIAQLEAMQEQRRRGRPFGFGRFPPRGPREIDFARPNGRKFFDRLIDELGLTEDQQLGIETIKSELRDNIKVRHMEAREAFRGILTPEQIQILDALEADKEEHKEGDEGE